MFSGCYQGSFADNIGGAKIAIVQPKESSKYDRGRIVDPTSNSYEYPHIIADDVSKSKLIYNIEKKTNRLYNPDTAKSILDVVRAPEDYDTYLIKSDEKKFKLRSFVPITDETH